MLNYISQKLQTAYALIIVFLICRLEDTKKKLHINYSVRGVATVAAVDKLELTSDAELYYIDPITADITKRFDQGYYDKHGLLVKGDTEWEVDLDSFKAKVPSTLDPKKVHVLNRQEFLASQDYRPDQARIVMPDGTVITNSTQIANVLAGREKLSNLLPLHESIETGNSDCADDESFALWGGDENQSSYHATFPRNVQARENRAEGTN